MTNSVNDPNVPSPHSLDDPVRKIIHEVTDPTRQIKADLVGFAPLDEDGSTTYALFLTGPKAHILAESVVGYLNTMAFRAEQKAQEALGNHGVNNIQ